MWSLGIIMHILLCGYAPFRSADRERLFALIREGALRMDEPVWHHVPDAARRLLRRLLQVDVTKRASARRVLANRWLIAMVAKCDAAVGVVNGVLVQGADNDAVGSNDGDQCVPKADSVHGDARDDCRSDL